MPMACRLQREGGNFTGLGDPGRAWYVPAIASGQLPSSMVEVGPSRVPTVLLPESWLLFFIVQAMLHGAVVRQRGKLRVCVGAWWWSIWWRAP